MLMPFYLSKAATPGLEYKYARFQATDVDITGTFSGYASVFGNEDLGGDVVRKGAFATSLKSNEPRSFKLLYEHDIQQPIGVWEHLSEDDHGLMAKGRLLIEDVAKAKEVHALMKAGVLDGLSIGYHVREASRDRSKNVRVLEDIDLKEISVVLFPMNEEAVIAAVKSSPDDLPTEREFERLLMQDAEQLGLPRLTRSEIRQFILPGYKSLLRTKQDAGREVASKPPAADWSALTAGLRQLTAAHREDGSPWPQKATEAYQES